MKTNTARLVTISGIIMILGIIIYGCVATSSNDSNSPKIPEKRMLDNNQPDSVSIDINKTNDDILKTNPSSEVENAKTIPSPLDKDDKINHSIDTSIIRPEVRHILQAMFTNAQELNVALNGASLLQSYLDNPAQDAILLLKRYDCTIIGLTQENQTFIKSLTFDTPERQQMLSDGLKEYQPPISVEIKIDDNGNAINPCEAF